jgi:hypothetical protein
MMTAKTSRFGMIVLFAPWSRLFWPFPARHSGHYWIARPALNPTGDCNKLLVRSRLIDSRAQRSHPVA